MDELIEILEHLQPEIDYNACTDLIDGHRLDSLTIIALVAELEDTYDITIPTVEVTAANLNSAGQIWKMIQRLQEE